MVINTHYHDSVHFFVFHLPYGPSPTDTFTVRKIPIPEPGSLDVRLPFPFKRLSLSNAFPFQTLLPFVFSCSHHPRALHAMFSSSCGLKRNPLLQVRVRVSACALNPVDAKVPPPLLFVRTRS